MARARIARATLHRRDPYTVTETVYVATSTGTTTAYTTLVDALFGEVTNTVFTLGSQSFRESTPPIHFPGSKFLIARLQSVPNHSHQARSPAFLH